MFPMADFVSLRYERATLMMDTLIWYHIGEILMLTWWLLIILVVGWGGGWAADDALRRWIHSSPDGDEDGRKARPWVSHRGPLLTDSLD